MGSFKHIRDDVYEAEEDQTVYVDNVPRDVSKGERFIYSGSDSVGYWSADDLGDKEKSEPKKEAAKTPPKKAAPKK